MKRNLLADEVEKTFNCVNGYFLENSIICICYPGWTSSTDGINLCNIDNGENKTKSTSSYTNGDTNNTDRYADTNSRYSDIPQNDEIDDITQEEFYVKVSIIIFILFIIIYIIKCCFRKCCKAKKIKMKVKDIEDEIKRKKYKYNYDDEYNYNSSLYKKQCKKINEEEDTNDCCSPKSKTNNKKIEDINKEPIELEVKNPK